MKLKKQHIERIYGVLEELSVYSWTIGSYGSSMAELVEGVDRAGNELKKYLERIR